VPSKRAVLEFGKEMGIVVPGYDRRRGRRFSLKHVAHLICDTGEMLAVTENISSDGVFLTTDSFIREGAEVHVSVILESEVPTKHIRLSGMGTVLRVESKGGRFGIALGLDHHFADQRPAKALT
jgi:PilZ domain